MHGEKVALFILFNDLPCFPESTTPRKKNEKIYGTQKWQKNDGKFSLRIQRAPKNFSRSLMIIVHSFFEKSLYLFINYKL